MRLKIKILDAAGNEKKEMIVEVPPNITVEGLIDTLRRKKPDLFDSKDYSASIDLPTSKSFSSNPLEDGALIIIRPKGWDLDVQIIE